MEPFEYLEPNNITEVCSLLSQYGDDAKVIAGGTDLIISMKKTILSPTYLIGMSQLPNLNHIDRTDTNDIRIGALSSLRDIEVSPLVRGRLPILAVASSEMASPAIRNIATIGGNLCNAAPSADTAPPLIALGAQAVLAGPKGERAIQLESFFTGPGTTVLNFDEILVNIQVPIPPPYSLGAYLKLKRTAVDIAIVGVALLATMDPEHETITDARIVLGAVAPTPIRAKRAEAKIIGQTMTEGQWIERAGHIAAEEAQPIHDFRASAEYRREMVKVLVRQAIKQVIASWSQDQAEIKE
jgi:carbon-monoxide dehydrogenase medium subunit